jgi:hypothetical protein
MKTSAIFTPSRRVVIELTCIVVSLFMLISSISNAQATYWNLSGSNIYNTNSGNVGIGTTTPLTTLQVGNITGSGGGLLIGQPTSYGLILNTPGTYFDYLYPTNNALNIGFNTTIGTPTAPAMTILSSGNVGIGTATPLAPLQVGSITGTGTGGVLIAQPTSYGLILNTPGSYFDCLYPTTNALNIGFNTAIGAPTAPVVTVLSSGNVGINTSTPGSQFNINVPNTPTNLPFTITNASNKLLVLFNYDQGGSMELGGAYGSANAVNGGTPYIDFHYGITTSQYYNTRIINSADGQMDFVTNYSAGAPVIVMSVLSNNTGSYVRATEVRVCLTGCDFVFDKGYKLMPLDTLNAYLKFNHHLPGIASAKEMEDAGSVALGKMDSQLLQKVEELTLYVLQQQKQIEEMQAKLNALNDTHK